MTTQEQLSLRSTSLDGAAFDLYGVRFNGTVELNGPETFLDAKQVWIVVTDTNGVAVKTKNDGNVLRVDVLKVSDCRAADDELATLLITKLGLDVGQAVPIDENNPRSQRTNYKRTVDPDTGAINDE